MSASATLQAVAERLVSDREFGEAFVADRQDALREYERQLGSKEMAALAGRDVDQLERLGLDRDLAIDATSNAHSQRCPG